MCNIHKKKYFKKLYGRVIKILYMYEEGSETINDYVKSLTRELMGNANEFQHDELFRIVGMLNGLDLSSHKKVRKDILDCCKMVEKIQKRHN